MNDLDVRKIRKDLGLSQADFAKKIGVDTRTIQNWEYGKAIPSSKHAILRSLINKSENACRNITDTVTDTKNNITLPLITIDAVAGFPTADNEGITLSECEQYNIPEFIAKGAQYLIRVSGSSMYPSYNNGDILACRKIPDITFFQWGKVYVLDTNQGALVKRLKEDKNDAESIICHSDNTEDYPDFKLPKTEIRSLSIVIGVIRIE